MRIIAATNKDLRILIQQGLFREDLFFRLNGISLTIPPLRERPEEIEALIQTFVAQACRQLEREPVGVPEDVTALLLRHSWPGNVRELKNVIERAVVLCDEPALRPANLPAAILAAVESSAPRPAVARDPESAAGRPKTMHEDVRSLERLRIIEALHKCNGNQTAAAKLLGISRRTLTTRLAEFGLPRPRKKSD